MNAIEYKARINKNWTMVGLVENKTESEAVLAVENVIFLAIPSDPAVLDLLSYWLEGIKVRSSNEAFVQESSPDVKTRKKCLLEMRFNILQSLSVMRDSLDSKVIFIGDSGPEVVNHETIPVLKGSRLFVLEYLISTLFACEDVSDQRFSEYWQKIIKARFRSNWLDGPLLDFVRKYGEYLRPKSALALICGLKVFKGPTLFDRSEFKNRLVKFFAQHILRKIEDTDRLIDVARILHFLATCNSHALEFIEAMIKQCEQQGSSGS